MIGYFTQSFYHASIIPLSITTAVLAWLARPSTKETPPPGFTAFQTTYLSVWVLCVAADWLQGPYVYALYSDYGFKTHEIAQLFVAGFGSSLIFGCIVGCVADRFGRKKCCLAYCAFYIISCVSKHFKSYPVLMLGRVTGGIATSLLFSCFECWMVSEHTVRYKFSGQMLNYLFGLKFTLMYAVAIISGLIAQIGADNYTFGPISQGSIFYTGGSCVPFDMSIGFLLVGGLLISLLWTENYGEQRELPGTSGFVQQASSALRFLCNDGRLACLCTVVACFEGAMFAFVFHWTPALATKTATPFGVIFSLFMMACMCGASVATLVSKNATALRQLVCVCAVALLAFAIASVTAGNQNYLFHCFLSFLLFEFCVGAYYPSIGMLKSQVVPENVRGTMYNLFRVPLNAIVVSLLLTHIETVTCFKLCTLLAGISLCVLAVQPDPSKSARSEPTETTAIKDV